MASLILGLMSISLVFVFVMDGITLYTEYPILLQNIKDGIQNIKDLTSSGKDNIQTQGKNPSMNNHPRLQDANSNKTLESDQQNMDSSTKHTKTSRRQDTPPGYRASVSQVRPLKRPYYVLRKLPQASNIKEPSDSNRQNNDSYRKRTRMPRQQDTSSGNTASVSQTHQPIRPYYVYPKIQ